MNARVWTGDARRPWADGVAVTGDRISSVGSSAAIRKLLSRDARVIDAAGQLLVPGFIDSHVHFVEGGHRLNWVQLAACSSRDDLATSIAEYAATVPAGTWILGGDWDHQRWGGELPAREWIDAVSPLHPVWVTRHDGHMGLANSNALMQAGVDDSTADPFGGAVVRDSYGVATGVLKDKAMQIVADAIPPLTDEDDDRALHAAMRHVAARGVTSVHNMGTWENLAVFRRAHERGALTTRIYAAVPLATWQTLREAIAADGRGDSWLRLGALKEFMDGSLGSHTALFHDDYADSPGERGLLLVEPEEFEKAVVSADATGLQCVTHAIGDRANTMLLDVYERVAAKNGARDRRFRIEHAQHLRESDIPRFAELGVIASVQPYHASDDGRWAEHVVGADRCRLTYAFSSLLDTGAKLAMGSDWFVAPPDPLGGINAAVNRTTLDGANPGGWIPEQKITVLEALHGYTTAAAYASFEESEKGTISEGKLADMVLLDRDITSIDASELSNAAVTMTIAGGAVIYER